MGQAQPAGHAWRQPDVCGPPHGQGCGPHGSKEPRYTGNCSKNHCSAPSAAFLQAIAIRACCGLPLQRDGRPERHRCARLLLEFVELCRWQSQCWRHGFHRCARCPLGLSEPGVGSGRALRPASAPKLFPNVRPRRIPAVPARRLRVLRENPCVPNFRARRPVPGDGRRPSFRRLQPVCTRPCGQG